MADNLQEASWPVPKFHFKITIGNYGEAAFQEVIGLDTEHDVIEYRGSNRPEDSMVKMPGLRKASGITLKKGVFQSDTKLLDYFNEVKMNNTLRQTVTIQLLDEKNNPMSTWTLKNAMPVKVSGFDLDAQNSEVAIEELELACEGLSFEKA